eukprot:7284784-Pyramimonas_sp.AAC.1
MQALVRKLVRKGTRVVGSEAATKGTRLLRGVATKGTLTIFLSLDCEWRGRRAEEAGRARLGLGGGRAGGHVCADQRPGGLAELVHFQELELQGEEL